MKDEDRKSRGGGRGRKSKGGGDEFMNDSSDLGDWERGEGGDGGEKRERKKKEVCVSRVLFIGDVVDGSIVSRLFGEKGIINK